MANDKKKETPNVANERSEQIDFASDNVVDKLITSFGGLRPFASSLGLAVGTVQGWKKRNSIPAAHQKRISELLGARGIGESELLDKDKSRGVANPSDTSIDTPVDTSVDTPSDTPVDTPKDSSSSEQAAIEESLVSAFTSEDSSSNEGRDSELDISSDVWEHASLPRSTSGHWAILISCIALIGVLTRPLWAERIDAKLMETIAGGSHSAESHTSDNKTISTESHSSESESHSSESESHSSESEASTQPDDASTNKVAQDLLERLLELEKEVSSLGESQEVPALAEMRRLKSEGSALAAAFDNQAARLDSLSKLLEEREETLASLRKKVDLVEQNDASARLTQRLNALFELENITYEIGQADEDFSTQLQTLEQTLERTLPSREYESLSRALTTLEQVNSMASARQLLADYRLLLTDLLAVQAYSAEASLGEKLRAQLFTAFSIRRRGDESDKNPFLKIEQLLEDHRHDRAERLLRQATAKWLSAEALEDGKGIRFGVTLGAENDPSSLRSRLASFQARLATRNSVFAALREIRQKLSGESDLSQ